MRYLKPQNWLQFPPEAASWFLSPPPCVSFQFCGNWPVSTVWRSNLPGSLWQPVCKTALLSRVFLLDTPSSWLVKGSLSLGTRGSSAESFCCLWAVYFLSCDLDCLVCCSRWEEVEFQRGGVKEIPGMRGHVGLSALLAVWHGWQATNSLLLEGEHFEECCRSEK